MMEGVSCEDTDSSLEALPKSRADALGRCVDRAAARDRRHAFERNPKMPKVSVITPVCAPGGRPAEWAGLGLGPRGLPE